MTRINKKSVLFATVVLVGAMCFRSDLAVAQTTDYVPPSMNFEVAPPPSNNKTVVAQPTYTPPLPLRKPPRPIAKNVSSGGAKTSVTANKKGSFRLEQSKGKPAHLAKVDAVPLMKDPKTLQDLEHLKEEAQPAPKRSASPNIAGKNTRKLSFNEGQTTISYGQTPALKAMVAAMGNNPTARLSIDAYATQNAKDSSSDARREALARGLAVRNWFREMGIASERMDIRALGSDGPRKNSDYVLLSISHSN